MSTDLYHEQCERVAADARAAGLRVETLISQDLGWRPGCIVAHALDDNVLDFARAHGYVATPSGMRRSIIETPRAADD